MLAISPSGRFVKVKAEERVSGRILFTVGNGEAEQMMKSVNILRGII